MKRSIRVLCVTVLLTAVASLVLAGSHTKLLTLDGDSATDRFGFDVSFAGDVNDDGYDDYIIGSYWDDDAGANAGRARVYSGKNGAVLYTLDGASAGDEFGRAVSDAGDVNDDGYADFIVGAPYNDDSGADAGAAVVYSGKDGTALHVFEGDSSGGRFGFDVQGAGDVNDDGYDDVIVGAYFDGTKGTEAGMARVFSGKDGKTIHTFYGDAAGDHFGIAVSGAGDVNADGYDDLVVGAYTDDDKGTSCGSARVFSGKDGKILYTYFGDSANDQLGRAVGRVGDVNGDGYDEFIVGAFYDDVNGTDSGTVYVHSGKDGTALYTVYGDRADDRLGRSVSRAGDVNGDGIPDFFAGAVRDDTVALDCGSARVFSGKDGSILQTFYGEGADDRFGVTVSGGGDVNGDGLADLLVGAHLNDANGNEAGRAYLYVSPAPGGTLKINSGEAGTSDTDVTLSMDWQAGPAGSPVTDMRLRNAGDAWGGWQPVAASAPWTLPPGEGLKTVEVQFQDAAGATSGPIADSIILDQTPPTGSMMINLGYELTLSVFVAIQLEYSDLQSEVTLVRFRNEGDAWGTWVPIAPEKSWVLSPGGGLKIVEAQFQDAAGNVSDTVADSIEFRADVAPPQIDTLRVNDGRPYVLPKEKLEIEVYGRDNAGGSGVDAFKLSVDAGKTWSDWYSLELGPIAEVQHPASEGLLTAAVVLRDRARNESEEKTITFYVVEAELPWLGAGGKFSGEISSEKDLDVVEFDLVRGDLLNVKVKPKGPSKAEPLDVRLDLVRPNGERLFTDQYPVDAKKVMIQDYEVPETGKYLLVVRRDWQSPAEKGSYKLKAKVKQARENKKGKGEWTTTEIPFHACAGSTFKALLKGEGLEPSDVLVFGPAGPVPFEAKGKTGKVKIPKVTLDAGTGPYRIEFESDVTVTVKWSLKLPKIKGTVTE